MNDKKKKKRKQAETLMKDRYKWVAVKAPKTWHPKMPGEELVGFYGGRTLKSGMFGQYDVVLVHVPGQGAFILSGAVLIRYIDASMVSVGDPLRIVWRGVQDIGEGKTMKDFEVYTAEEKADECKDDYELPYG